MSVQRDLLELSHIPVRPARPDMPEAAFLATWQRFIVGSLHGWDEENIPASEVFQQRDFVWLFDQRAATVAASFVTWLGTSCGGGFLHSAEQWACQANRPFHREDAYAAAWAVENTRSHHINRGIRTIEHLLAPEEVTDPTHALRPWHASYSGIGTLGITLADCEVIECIVRWLAGPRGRAFLVSCKANAAALLADQRLKGALAA